MRQLLKEQMANKCPFPRGTRDRSSSRGWRELSKCMVACDPLFPGLSAVRESGIYMSHYH